jgi:hypothetical protein
MHFEINKKRKPYLNLAAARSLSSLPAAAASILPRAGHFKPVNRTRTRIDRIGRFFGFRFSGSILRSYLFSYQVRVRFLYHVTQIKKPNTSVTRQPNSHLAHLAQYHVPWEEHSSGVRSSLSPWPHYGWTSVLRPQAAESPRPPTSQP